MKFRIFKLGTTLVLFLLPLSLLSQTNNSETTEEEVSDYSFLMINASYTSNNLSYLANPTDTEYQTEKIPTLFTNLTYANKIGIYLGGSYSNYFNASTQTYEYEIEAGYQKYFDNGFDFDLSYNWHKFTGDTLLEGLKYDHSISLMFGQDIGKFYLSGDLNYKAGKSNNVFFDLGLSRFIQIDGVFTKNDALLINPGISLSFGTDFWLYEDMSETDKINWFSSLKQEGYSYENFGYEAFNIFIPVSYGIKNVYLTASWLYRIPGKKYEYLGWENQSGFMFSLTYFLNFNK